MSLKILFERLRPGGIYLIEDLHCSYFPTHEGGFRRPGSSIEWLKQLVEAVNYDHIDRDSVDAAELLRLSDMSRSVAGISFYDSVAVVEKFALEKSKPFRRLLSGTVDAVVSTSQWMFIYPRDYIQAMVLGSAAARALSADLLALVETTRNDSARAKAQFNEISAIKVDLESRLGQAEAVAREIETKAADRTAALETRNAQAEAAARERNAKAEAAAREIETKAADRTAALESRLAAAEARFVEKAGHLLDSEARLRAADAARERLSADLDLARRRLAAKAQELRAASDVLDRGDIAAASSLADRVAALMKRHNDSLVDLADVWTLAERSGLRLAGLTAGADIVERRLTRALTVIDELRSRILDGSRSRTAHAARLLRRLAGRGGSGDTFNHARIDAAVGLDPLLHYALHGAVENRPTMPGATAEQHATGIVLRLSGLFDEAYYRARYPGVVAPDSDALAHFVETGALQGHDPSASFSTAAYLRDNPDVAAAGTNPLLHYALHGRREGRPTHAPATLVADDPSDSAAAAAADLIISSGLFDPDWYASHYADVPVDEVEARRHFIDHGRSEGRSPNAGFDPVWYAAHYPDTGGPSEALLHYIRHGAAEGRRPSEVFDAAWYAETYPDVPGGPGAALAHYVRHGRTEGRQPHGSDATATAHGDQAFAPDLFDAKWYVSRYSDVPREADAAWRHFQDRGHAEARQPNAYFDPDWYATRYPDVGGPTSAFRHYAASGAAEGRHPSGGFDAAWYLRNYPDVSSTTNGPLGHYLQFGRTEGRQIRSVQTVPGEAFDRLIVRYREAGDVQAETLLAMKKDGLHTILDRFSPYSPINVYLDEAKRNDPVVYIVLPSIRLEHATGGPNTALILGCELAARDIPVVFLSTTVGPDEDLGLIKGHLRKITGFDVEALPVGFATAHDNSRALGIGENDLFLATAWWTALAVSSAANLCRHKSIYYLIQDYESTFYSASTLYTLAEASYGLRHRPIFNTSLLRDHFVEKKVGRFRDPAFSAAALVFEPAIDANLFYPELKTETGVRTLLFYARPTKAERNLFSNGVAALRSAIARGAFDGEDWRFIGMGEAFAPVALGNGHVLTPAPWLGVEEYAAMMRQADLLLSLMLSPHPSYPPLEMAACGGVVVTTTYGSKTADRLAAISPFILAVEPEIQALASALCTGADVVRNRVPSDLCGLTSFPKSWAEALGPVMDMLGREMRTQWQDIERMPRMPAASAGFPNAEDEKSGSLAYTDFNKDRRYAYSLSKKDLIFSFVTPVFNTDPQYLVDLARCVFAQPTEYNWEWVILDNGSSRRETFDVLAMIAKHKRVRLCRLQAGRGIIGGSRWLLEHAVGDYIVPLDHDDLVSPNCLNVVAAYCVEFNYPDALYTDEDKRDENGPRDAYIKPDWDEVLFVHSCYTSHLAVIKRSSALAAGLYSDEATEGSPDWDAFMRLISAGAKPIHIPELLYTWRMHDGSTAGNYRSKPYIYASHHAVLRRFLTTAGKNHLYDIRLAPLFDGTPDYQFVRRNDAEAAELFAPDAVQSLGLHPIMTRAELLRAARAIPVGVPVVHLHDGFCDADEESSVAEALTLLDLFPDTAIVGGRIHDGRVVLEGGYVFGYGGVVGCPDGGRALRDPGYFAQSWKPRSVGAVSARHCYVRRDFLLTAVAELPDEIEIGMLGPWLGAVARETARRVVWSPYVSARGRISAVSPTDFEAALFSRRFPTLSTDVTGYARHLDKSGLRPFAPCRDITAPRLPGYAAFLDAELAARVRDWPVKDGDASSISILTTVYVKTSASLFEETARAVRRQTRRPLEWLVLAHGPISADLEAALSRLSTEGLVTVLREEVNLGIQGGLRRCLEAASGDFILSLDADDLLTRDAIQILTAAAARHPSAAILYSDEDLLIEGDPKHPFYRPDFDPVLLTGTSFVWHAILFRRDAGLRTGVYTSSAAEYAQDWDVLVRFYAAGHQPVHIPAVLYHWRQHGGSLSNSGTLFEGSVRSVHAVLAQIRDASPIADRLQIAEYPANLGQASYYLERLATDAPAVQVLRLTRPEHPHPEESSTRPVDVPNARWSEAKGASFEAVRNILGEGPEELVLIIGDSIRTLDIKGYWQALKHIEMHPNCVAVGGPIIDRESRIVRGPLVTVHGALTDETAGLAVSNPGPFSLHLQAHVVVSMGPDCLLIRREALRHLLASIPPNQPLDTFALWLAKHVGENGGMVVYEPLLRVRGETTHLIGEAPDSLNSRNSIAGHAEAIFSRVRGTAGFIQAKAMHA